MQEVRRSHRVGLEEGKKINNSDIDNYKDTSLYSISKVKMLNKIDLLICVLGEGNSSKKEFPSKEKIANSKDFPGKSFSFIW